MLFMAYLLLIALNIPFLNAGRYVDGILYVYITKTPPQDPTPSTFNVTIFEDKALYESILELGVLPNDAVYSITGRGDSSEFFGIFQRQLHVIKPLIERSQGVNR